MLYNPKTGKRVKTPFNHVTWVHSMLRIPHFNLRQCFFGEHLLSKEKQKPIAIVESEKTALIASFYLPQYLWIATGGKNGCFRADTLTPLMKRQIVLFPDLGATDYWLEKMTMMRKIGFEVRLFDYLEKTASAKDLKAGYDIADYLLQIEPKIELINNLTLTKEVENLYQKSRKESHEARPTPRKRGSNCRVASLCFGIPKTSLAPPRRSQFNPDGLHIDKQKKELVYRRNSRSNQKLFEFELRVISVRIKILTQ